VTASLGDDLQHRRRPGRRRGPDGVDRHGPLRPHAGRPAGHRLRLLPVGDGGLRHARLSSTRAGSVSHGRWAVASASGSEGGGVISGRHVMGSTQPELGGPLGPLAALRQIVPFEAAAASDWLGWGGLEAARYRAAPASELNLPVLTHHWLVLVTRPPEELDLRYEGVKRHAPPPAGSISLLPAGSRVPVALARVQGLVAHPPGAGVGRAGRRRGVRPRPGAADGAFARWPGPPPTAGRDVGGGRRVDRWRRRGTTCRRVPGQRPGCPPDPARPGTPPA